MDTLGSIAADLGDRAGVRLEPWQRDGLDMLLSTREDGRWACYEYAELCSRRNGKTAMMLVRALFGFLLLGETPILWTAQEVKTSMRAWRDFRKMLWALGERVNDNLVDLGQGVQVRINASNGKEGFERVDTGQELKMVARSKDSGRGFDADFIVIDEAYDFTAEQQDALAPTQMARPHAQIAYASSPPLSGARSEALYRLRDRAEQRASARLGWRDWGRAERLDDVLMLPKDELNALLDDPQVWASCNPALGRGRVTEETVRNMRDSMTEAGFAREVLGMWPTAATGGAGWAVITEDSWRGRGGGKEIGKPSGPVAFALDASYPDGVSSSISVAGQHSAEVLAQVVAHYPGTGWVIPRVVEMARRHRPLAVVLDESSPANYLKAELEDALAALGVPLLLPNTRDRCAAAGELRAAVAGDAPFLRHYDQDELDAAVAAVERRPVGDSWAWARRGDVDISPLTSVSMAVWALLRAAPEPPAPVAVTGGEVETRSETADLAGMGF